MSETTIKEKVKKPRKSKKQNSYWLELVSEEGKKDLQKIVTVLCRYYALQSPLSGIDKSTAHQFRLKLTQTSPENFKAYFKKFGQAEYLIVVILKDVSNPETPTEEIDSWIHIDGIAQEREIMREKGKLDHPVFKIVSVGDLYENMLPVPKDFSLPVPVEKGL